MMRSFLKSLFVFVLIMSYGCSNSHLFKNKEYLALVEKSFIERKQISKFRDSQLFSVFNKSLSDDQSQALKFLIAFMPLNDLADYDGDFFLANVNYSLKARMETPWGKNIPEDIFLHYVLPCRINNENLDSFRIVYYNEIMNRISEKNLHEAALEINHWCHEKVTYQPSDIRTSAPMSTILSARGRCGEESTFTVAALRTAGIPARQVYTPRWAHSDDNHAWVEIWDNGTWYYMGACEPEPVLDQGWFTEPARRAMLVHTKSFGAPMGNENTIITRKNYSVINNLAKYAVTKQILVKILDNNGNPVSDANVEYGLYNYAEFYPLAVVPTDKTGISLFETGLGDLLVWAYKNGIFDYAKIAVNETDTLTLVLKRKPGENYTINLDLHVPVALPPLPVPSPELTSNNSERIEAENMIRQKYTNSWIDSTMTKEIAINLNINPEKFINIISRSMGNYKEIVSFVTLTPDSLRDLALKMLEHLPDKDLRDTKGTTLYDHLKFYTRPERFYSKKYDNLCMDYILNPRIANEIIRPWRSYLLENLPELLTLNGTNDPILIVEYVNENIKIDS
jgi:hypothetical protein